MKGNRWQQKRRKRVEWSIFYIKFSSNLYLPSVLLQRVHFTPWIMLEAPMSTCHQGFVTAEFGFMLTHFMLPSCITFHLELVYTCLASSVAALNILIKTFDFTTYASMIERVQPVGPDLIYQHLNELAWWKPLVGYAKIHYFIVLD